MATTQGEHRIDAASALWQGRRAMQQDSLASDFPIGGALGLAVLADGMGGHPAGDLASRIAVTEVFADLKLRGTALGTSPSAALTLAAHAANRCIAAQTAQDPATFGMGTTLIALVLDGAAAHWISIGDSLLLLWRDGGLSCLNHRHSYAERLDQMVERGEISAAESKSHPDRRALTSCLNGGAIAQIDCPCAPMPLQEGDILVMASDGIETLTLAEIAALIRHFAAEPATFLAQALLAAVRAKGDPAQDNLALTIIRPLVPSLGSASAPWPLSSVRHRSPRDTDAANGLFS